MTHSSNTELVLQLQRVDELFNAPDCDPFSSRAIDVLGESGFEVVWKRMVRRWPQRSDLQRVIVQLPPDQLTPTLADAARAAWQHYCSAKIEDNRQRRRVNTGKALRLWGYAGILLLLTLGLIILLFAGPLQILPEWLRALLSILAVYAFALANWDALDSLLFDWAPFVRDNATYTLISALDLRFESQP
jgi:hypothetical protein